MSGYMAKHADAKDEFKDLKMRLLVDSMSTIDLGKHSVGHGRRKHIETSIGGYISKLASMLVRQLPLKKC